MAEGTANSASPTVMMINMDELIGSIGIMTVPFGKPKPKLRRAEAFPKEAPERDAADHDLQGTTHLTIVQGLMAGRTVLSRARDSRLGDWSPQLLKSRLYGQLLVDIIVGRLAPGERLDERAL